MGAMWRAAGPRQRALRSQAVLKEVHAQERAGALGAQATDALVANKWGQHLWGRCKRNEL